MSSTEFKIIKRVGDAMRLDDLIKEVAKTFNLREWTGGFEGDADESGGVRVATEQFARLQEDLGAFEDNTLVQEIFRLLGDLELVEAKPDYEEFKTLFVKQILIKSKPKIVFLLGAGSSKSPPSNIPTINEMLGVIVSKLPPSENPMTNKIREWSSRKNITIEDIMTAGYLSSQFVSNMTLNRLVGEIVYRAPLAQTSRELESSRSGLPQLRDIEYVVSFRDVIDRIFSIISGIMIKADSNPVHDSIARLLKILSDKYEFSLLTTNYDVCMERALQKQDLKPRYLGIESADGIPLVKIHGSINWFYCEGCQNVVFFTMDELNKFDKVYPTTASCLKCNTLAQLFMVPPLAYKYVTFPPIIDIWQSAMRILEEADLIIVIGYSFSLSDDYLLKMIVSGLKKKSPTLVFLTNSGAVVRSLQRRLLAYHETIRLSLIEDASVSVPTICKIIEDVSSGSKEEAAQPTT
jgi:NAD-dependent SIR2 family protein deacetylase